MIGGVTDKFVSVDERVFISAADGTLQFSYTLKEDANSYACTLALPSQQGGHYGPWFRLHLPGIGSKPTPFAPRIDEYGPLIVPDVPVRGQTVLLECFAYGFPAPTYSWSRADGTPLSNRHRITNYGRVLRIENAQLEDAVRYACTAKNDLGTTTADVKLIIQTPPTILQSLTDQLVAVNATITFTCAVSNVMGHHVSVEWFRNGTPIVPLLLGRDDRHRYFVRGHELVVARAQTSDTGVFQCIVSNDVGSASSSSYVLVRNIPPKFHGNVLPERIFLTEGSKLASLIFVLPCTFHANPMGKAVWNRLSAGSGARLKQKSIYGVTVLHIDAVTSADSGDYECYVNNGVGEERAIVTLNVLGWMI
ncbi:CRE-RIG-6 protein [Aphelenchoides avenae]|nr:CRE-RIG-6 protein [Aphelenchus avenae]